MTRERWVDEVMGRLTLRQKVGQMLVLGFCGPVVTPDVIELIRKHEVGGLRVSTKFRGLSMISDLPPGSRLPEFKERSFRYPTGSSRDFSDNHRGIAATPQQYAETLNTLRQIALERPSGVPIHCACDQEGNAVDDMVLGQRFFPHPMGLAATGDTALVERCTQAIAEQLHALGINMIHSPVLDVNTNPENPEVGTRAYSDRADTTIDFALATLRGFSRGGLTSTGKHFPGRGESNSDAHHGLPTMDATLDDLKRIHLAPFKALIDEGLPAIMMAHSLYPALGVDDLPASADPRVIQDLLRGEMGFDGVVETDNMMMGGVLQKWDLLEATLRVIEGGCDLVLLRDEGPVRLELFDAIEQAVQSGRISEQRVDASVARILRMRYDMGLSLNGGKVEPAEASKPIEATDTIAAAREAAEKSVLVVRDRKSLLPVTTDTQILLVEQVFPAHLHANNFYSHPGLLWEALAAEFPMLASVEIPYLPGPGDIERVERRLDSERYDLIVTTSWYYHKDGRGGDEVLKRLLERSTPIIAITNSPYAFAVPEALDTAITIFHPGAPEHMLAAARVLSGALKPTAKLPALIPGINS